MQPKEYIMYQFEKLSNEIGRTEKRKMDEAEFYDKSKIKKEQVEQYYGNYEELSNASNYIQAMRKYLIVEVKKLHKELNRNLQVEKTPTQEEFCQRVDRYYVRRFFNSYNDLLIQAGLRPNKVGVGRKKETKDE